MSLYSCAPIQLVFGHSALDSVNHDCSDGWNVWASGVRCLDCPPEGTTAVGPHWDGL